MINNNAKVRLRPFSLITFLSTCVALALTCSSSISCAQDGETDGLKSLHRQTSKDISIEDFESAWGGIQTCNVMFYSPEKGEATLEDGVIYRYLLNRGYQVVDSGQGYFSVSQLHESFRGYVMEALTLPGEWGVYGMDIVAKVEDIRKTLFPNIPFKKKIVDKANGTTTMTAQLKSSNDSVATLVLREKLLSKTRSVTSVSCFIESGN